MRVLTRVVLLIGLTTAAGCGGSGSAPAPSTAGASFGVPECDDYIAKYEACLNGKVPDAARDMVRQQLDATRASWKQAASTPEGKASLAAGCKMATETARTAMQAYGCTF
jgi:hypothetical protein